MNKKIKIKKIDILEKPLDILKNRKATEEELNDGASTLLIITGVKEKIGEVDNYFDLAKETILGNINSNQIDEKLKNDKNYKKAQSTKTPKKLLNYQKTNDKSLQEEANNEVINNGVILSKDQVLFHGGKLQNKTDSEVTNETLSTTLNPHVAISNALHRAKAYNDGELHLNILTTKDDDIKAFVFNNRTKMSYEREVLLENNLQITKTKEIFIKELEVPDGKDDKFFVNSKEELKQYSSFKNRKQMNFFTWNDSHKPIYITIKKNSNLFNQNSMRKNTMYLLKLKYLEFFRPQNLKTKF